MTMTIPGAQLALAAAEAKMRIEERYLNKGKRNDYAGAYRNWCKATDVLADLVKAEAIAEYRAKVEAEGAAIDEAQAKAAAFCGL